MGVRGSSMLERGKRRRITGRVGAVLGAAALIVPLMAGAASADGGTGTVAVCLTSSAGVDTALGWDQAWIQSGSSAYVGPVGDSGCRETNLPAGTNATVWVGLSGTTSDKRSVTVVNGQTVRVDFYSTNVTIQYPGGVAYGGPTGDSAWFKQSTNTASQELLSDGVTPTVFRMSTPAGFVRTPVSWPVAAGPGAKATFSLMAMQVMKNDKTGESGATATYRPNQYGYFVSGSTNADGLLGWSRPGLLTDVAVTAKVNNTTQTQTRDVSTNGLFTFQTTNLALKYNGEVRYFSSQYAYFFTGPSMELFSGDYPFQFRSPALGNAPAAYSQTTITVPTASQGPVTKTAAVVRFTDSTGNGMSGSVLYYVGGWKDPGVVTNMTAAWGSGPNAPLSDGSAVVLFDGTPTNVTFAMVHDGAQQNLPALNLQTDSIARFATVKVTLSLSDHTGAALQGGAATFYARSWQSFGATSSDGTVSKELLPVQFSFRVTYLGSSQTLAVSNVGTTPNTTFQTGQLYSCGAGAPATTPTGGTPSRTEASNCSRRR